MVHSRRKRRIHHPVPGRVVPVQGGAADVERPDQPAFDYRRSRRESTCGPVARESKGRRAAVHRQRLQAARAVAGEIEVRIDVCRAAEDGIARAARADRRVGVLLASESSEARRVQQPQVGGLPELSHDAVVDQRRRDRADVGVRPAQVAPVGWRERAQLAQRRRELDDSVAVVPGCVVARSERSGAAVAGGHVDVARAVDRHALAGPDPRLALARSLRLVHVVDRNPGGRHADHPWVIAAAVAQPAAKRNVDIPVRKSKRSTLLGHAWHEAHGAALRGWGDVDGESRHRASVSHVHREHLVLRCRQRTDQPHCVDDAGGGVDDRRARDPDGVDLGRTVVGRHARPSDHMPHHGPGALVQAVDAVVLGHGDDEPVPDQGFGVDVAVERGVPLR